MNKMYETMIKRLENKREEFKKEQEYFTVMCHNEMNTSNFERNAINNLLVMQQLKTEISELEHLSMMCQMFNKVIE